MLQRAHGITGMNHIKIQLNCSEIQTWQYLQLYSLLFHADSWKLIPSVDHSYWFCPNSTVRDTWNSKTRRSCRYACLLKSLLQVSNQRPCWGNLTGNRAVEHECLPVGLHHCKPQPLLSTPCCTACGYMALIGQNGRSMGRQFKSGQLGPLFSQLSHVII